MRMSITKCQTVKGAERRAGLAVRFAAVTARTQPTSSDSRRCRIWPELHSTHGGQSDECPGAGARLTRTQGSAPYWPAVLGQLTELATLQFAPLKTVPGAPSLLEEFRSSA